MNDILMQIRSDLPSFSKGQKRIANYILESYDKAAFMTASRLGKMVEVSESKSIYIVGVLSSAALAAFLNFYLRNMFENVRLVGSTSTSEMFEQLLRVGPEDVVIGFSLPRYSSRTVKVMQYAHDTGATCIAVTDKPDAPAGKVADHVLVAKSDMVSVVDSLVAPMSVVNALVVSLAQEQQTQMAKTYEDLETLWDEYDVYERVE